MDEEVNLHTVHDASSFFAIAPCTRKGSITYIIINQPPLSSGKNSLK